MSSALMSRRPVREQRTGRPCWPRHKKQVADLVLLTTAKVSQRTLDADADRAMLDALLEEVGDE